MKLLLDQNLSPRLVTRLAGLYSGLAHVADVQLDRASDIQVWDYARMNGFMLVTKDTDFSDLSVLRGFPPRVVWIRRGNCSTTEIEVMLRQNHDRLAELDRDPHQGMLMLL